MAIQRFSILKRQGGITMDNYFYSFKNREAKELIKGIKIRSVFLEKTMKTYMEFELNTLFPEHNHPHEQITMILEGRMDMIVDGTKKTVIRGDVIAVPANVIHSAQVLEEFTITVDAGSPAREDYK